MKIIHMLIFVFVSKSTSSQNLVVNSSFELYNKIPIKFSTSPEEFSLPGWSSPTRGTPDYFNASSIGESGVPFNWAGNSYAHTGKAYAGIYAGSKKENHSGNFGKSSYREYIQGTLSQPLISGESYEIEFYFKLSTNAGYSGDRIGLVLLNNNQTYTHDDVINISPLLSVIRPPLNAGNWELAQMLYKAKGGESFFILGNFYNNDETGMELLEFRQGRSTMLTGSCYYYIDDIRIESLQPDEPIHLTENVTSNKTSYLLKNVLFEFNDYKLTSSSFPELDSIADIMHVNKEWKAEINGHTDSEGLDDYNYILSVKRAEAVRNYLISKNIEESRIIAIGFGKQIPLTSEPKLKHLNRRVEMNFIEQ